MIKRIKTNYRGLSLDVSLSKDITTIVGPNGSGKSTVLDLVSCIASGKAIVNWKPDYFLEVEFFTVPKFEGKIKGTVNKTTYTVKGVMTKKLSDFNKLVNTRKLQYFANVNTNDRLNINTYKLARFTESLMTEALKGRDIVQLTKDINVQLESWGIPKIIDFSNFTFEGNKSISELPSGHKLIATLILIFNTDEIELILIDEAENSLHPNYAMHLTEFISTISNRQVIMTSHSPLILSEKAKFVSLSNYAEFSPFYTLEELYMLSTNTKKFLNKGERLKELLFKHRQDSLTKEEFKELQLLAEEAPKNSAISNLLTLFEYEI